MTFFRTIPLLLTLLLAFGCQPQHTTAPAPNGANHVPLRTSLQPQAPSLTPAQRQQHENEFFAALSKQKRPFSTKNHVDRTWEPRTKNVLLANPFNVTLDLAHLPEGYGPEPAYLVSQIGTTAFFTPSEARFWKEFFFVGAAPTGSQAKVFLSSTPDGTGQIVMGEGDELWCHFPKTTTSLPDYYIGDIKLAAGTTPPIDISTHVLFTGAVGINCNVHHPFIVTAPPESEWFTIYNNLTGQTETRFYNTEKIFTTRLDTPIYMVNNYYESFRPSYEVDIEVEPDVFSPANHEDALPDTTTLKLITGPNEVTHVEIYRPNPANVSPYWLFVTTVDVPLTEGSKDVVWDGRDSSGNYLPDGAYAAFAYSDNWDDRDLFTIYNNLTPSPSPTPSSNPDPSASPSATPSVSPSPSPTASPSPSPTVSPTPSPTVSAPPSSLGMSVSTPYISPANQDGQFDNVQLNVSAVPGQNWFLSIPAANKTFPAGVGSQSVVWDGRDNAGNLVSDGLYSVQVISGIEHTNVQVGIDNTAPEITDVILNEMNGQTVISAKIQDPNINGSAFGITGFGSLHLAVQVGSSPIQIASGSLSDDSGFGLASLQSLGFGVAALGTNTNPLTLQFVLNQNVDQVAQQGFQFSVEDDGFNVAVLRQAGYAPKGQPQFKDKSCATNPNKIDGINVELGLVKDFDLRGPDLTFVVLASGEDELFLNEQNPVTNTTILAEFRDAHDQKVASSAIDGKNLRLASVVASGAASLESSLRQDHQMVYASLDYFDAAATNPWLKANPARMNDINGYRRNAPTIAQLTDELKQKGIVNPNRKTPHTTAVMAIGADLDPVFTLLKAQRIGNLPIDSVILTISLRDPQLSTQSYITHVRLSLDNPNANNSTWVVQCEKK